MEFDDGSYRVFVEKRFEKVIKRNLPSHLVKALDRKIKYFKDNPKHPSLNTKSINVSDAWCKRMGVDEVFEFRVTMSFRCVFYVIHEGKEIILAFVGNHEDVKKHVK